MKLTFFGGVWYFLSESCKLGFVFLYTEVYIPISVFLGILILNLRLSEPDKLPAHQIKSRILNLRLFLTA